MTALRRLAVVTVALGLLAGAAAATPSTGLRGLVTISPARPVCIEEERCSKPAAGVTLVFRTGEKTTRVKTGADGRYRVLLTPGRYAVSVAGYRRGATIAPSAVRVAKAKLKRIDFDIDSGLRLQ